MPFKSRYALNIAILATAILLQSGAAGAISVKLRAAENSDSGVVEEVQLYAKSYALVIGIDEYANGWPRLSNAVGDAKAVAEVLEGKGFEVTLKLNPDSDGLKKAFEEFFISRGADKDARLFVWYAGHGHTENGEGYLIPADAPRPDVGTMFKFRALPMRRFGEYVRLAESKHAFAIFDSCFAGTVFGSARSMPPVAITRATTLPVRQFLTSGDANQTVSDDGTFRSLFLRALEGEENADVNGDGYLTASEIGLFLTDRVTNLTRTKQTPRYGKLLDKNYDRGDFVFALASPSPVSAGSAPVKPAVEDEIKRLREEQSRQAAELERQRRSFEAERKRRLEEEAKRASALEEERRKLEAERSKLEKLREDWQPERREVAALPLSRFDGKWTMSVQLNLGSFGECEGIEPEPMTIEKGEIEGYWSHPEDSVNISGKIDEAGNAKISIQGSYAQGESTGQFSDTKAIGKYSIYESELGVYCDGIWEASKVAQN